MVPAVALYTKIAAAVTAAGLGTVGYFAWRKHQLNADQQAAVDTALSSTDPQGAANMANTLQSQGHDDAAARVAAHAQALSNATGQPIDTGTAPVPPPSGGSDPSAAYANYGAGPLPPVLDGGYSGTYRGRPYIAPPVGRVNLWRNARVHALHPAWMAHVSRTLGRRGHGGGRPGLPPGPRPGLSGPRHGGRPPGPIGQPRPGSGTAGRPGPQGPAAPPRHPGNRPGRPGTPPRVPVTTAGATAAHAGTAALDPIAHAAQQAAGGLAQTAAGAAQHAGQTLGNAAASAVAHASAPVIATAAHAAQHGLNTLLNDMSGGGAPPGNAPSPAASPLASALASSDDGGVRDLGDV